MKKPIVETVRMLGMVAVCVAALGAFAKDTCVLVMRDGGQRAVHRFAVTNAGGANETWVETNAFCTFSTSLNICNVIPAHGYYYVCYGGGDVWRYSKAGVALTKIGNLAGGACFEMSADQAYIYGSKLDLTTGGNYIGQLHLGSGANTVFITNDIAQVRCLAWGSDGLLYAASRSNGSGTDYYGGRTIKSGDNRGVQAFDVSSGYGPVLKHYYKINSSTGGCAVDAANGRVYSFTASWAYVFGRAEDGPDGERSDLCRASNWVSQGNPFAGALIAGRAYAADWHNSAANVYRMNPDNTVTLVTTITNVTQGYAETLSTIHAIREDTFPEEDSTIAITRLSDYWSFNHAGETAENISRLFTSKVNVKRVAALSDGFTAGVRGVVREGLWCRAGAHATLESAVLVPQTNNFTLTCFLGFPSSLKGEQVIFANPKLTVSVTADGYLKASLPDGADIDGVAATGATVTGTTPLADGAWHQIGVVRRANRLEVWTDAVREGESAETAVSVYDNIQTQWSLLKAANANVMFLDEVRVYTAALTAGDFKLLRRIATSSTLVAPPNPAERSDAAAQAVGTVIAHADAADHAWGVPMVVADAVDGTLYAAADFGRDKGKSNPSVIWKSTDKGDTWTRVKSVPSFSRLALFQFAADGAGSFHAAGLDPDTYRPWGFSLTNGCEVLTNAHAQSSTVLPSPWYPAPCPTGYARNAALDGGVYHLNVMSDNQGYLLAFPTSASNRYNTAGIHAGGAFSASDGVMTAFYHQTVKRHEYATNATPREVLSVVRREGEKTLTYRGTTTFPGASRPFGVVWDSNSKRYWAVVTYAEDESQTPWKRANRLALYTATNLVAWRKCCDLATAGTPSTAGFNTPNLTVLGDDLVVVFGASLNDTTGTAGTRDVNVSNYILSKRIAGFRALAPASEPVRTRTLLVGDSSAGRIMRLEEDDAIGQWVVAGYFAPGNYTDKKYGMGCGEEILYRDGKVWILQNGRIFAFLPDGTFTGTYFDLTLDRTVVPYNPDGMGFSYDGRYLYSIHAFDDRTSGNTRYIYRTDIATGVTTQFCSSNDPNLDSRLWKARALTGLPDGSVAVTCRDGQLLFRIKEDGTFMEDIWTNLSGPQTLYFDRHLRRLYICGFNFQLYCWDYSTGKKTSKTGFANIIGITGDKKGRVFGSAYNAPAGISDLLADGGDFKLDGHCEILLGGDLYFRCCFFDTTPPHCTVLFIR